MRSDPLLRLEGDIHERLKVTETKRGSVSPEPRLILERSGESRCEEGGP